MRDVVRDLVLSKDKAVYSAPFMKSNNWLSSGTKITYYRDRDKEFRKYCRMIEEPSFVYCNDVEGLINMFQPGIYKEETIYRCFQKKSQSSITS